MEIVRSTRAAIELESTLTFDSVLVWVARFNEVCSHLSAWDITNAIQRMKMLFLQSHCYVRNDG
jgi:hypothetical protein